MNKLAETSIPEQIDGEMTSKFWETHGWKEEINS